MKIHTLVAGLLSATLILPAPAPVRADAGQVAAGVAAGILGTLAVQNANKNRQRTSTKTVTKKVYRAPAISSAQREQNRQVQTSLNYFGFPAGTPDGILGRNSRAAISNYQAHMGYAATGQLTDFERDFLLRSHSRAQAGGYATQQLVVTLPQGQRGLLQHYRTQEARSAGMVPTQQTPMQPQAVQQVMPAPGYVATTTVVAPGAVAPAPAPAPAAAPAVQPPAPAAAAPTVEAAATPDAAPLVPNFLGNTQAASVTAHCNMVNLRTSSSGGFVTLASMSDPQTAMDEQFCLARTFAIARGDEQMAKVQGATPAQIEAQCASFGPLLKDQVAGLSIKDPATIMAEVESFALSSGVPPAQLKGTAEICLAVGYRTDDTDVTLASAMLLSVLGQKPYAELMGHHILNGLGASPRDDLALAWYKVGLDAIDAGATPVFGATLPERNDLIRASMSAMSGTTNAATGSTQEPVKASALPTFTIAQ